MSFLDTLVDAAAGVLRQIFGAGQAPAAPTDTTDASSTPPSSGDVVQAGSVAPAVPEAPAGAGRTVLPILPVELSRIMPSLPEAKVSLYLPPLNAAMYEFGVTTGLRAAAFLAQLAHESSELRSWTEDLNYGAPGLWATFPSHFGSLAEAATYARQPERIANRVYANRMGNGDEASGDGWRYRGRGPLELTGLDGYRGIGAALGVDLVGDPDLAATPEIGFRIAGHYWRVNGCNEKADAGNFEAVTRAINGGLNGLASREAYYARAREVLGA